MTLRCQGWKVMIYRISVLGRWLSRTLAVQPCACPCAESCPCEVSTVTLCTNEEDEAERRRKGPQVQVAGRFMPLPSH